MAEEIHFPFWCACSADIRGTQSGLENQSDAQIMNADHSVGIRLSTRDFTGSLLAWRNLKRTDHLLRRRGERQVPQLVWNCTICDAS
jgi:hypothetical protein